MAGTLTADVAVVGGGAIGASVALYAARRGASVVLLERGASVASGCSAGNSGLVCPTHCTPLASPAALRFGLRSMLRSDSPFYLHPRPAVVPWLLRFATASTPSRARASAVVIRELAELSLAQHEALAAEGLDTGFRRDGLLNVFETEKGLAAGRAEAAALEAEAGMRFELLSDAEAREREPALGSRLAGAVFSPDDAHVDPERYVKAAAAAAASAGATVRVGSEVLRVRRSGNRIDLLETTSGDVRAGQVVMAAGVWSAAILRDVGLVCPIEGGKGYHVEVAEGEGDPALPVFLMEARVIVTPLPGRVRMAGTLELSGLDTSVNQRRLDAVRVSAERSLPALAERRVVHVWRGLRPCAPDGLPMIGRSGELENLVFATGHGPMGMTLAPVTGRLVAELLARDEPSYDLTALAPERFRGLRAAAGGRPRASRPRAPRRFAAQRRRGGDGPPPAARSEGPPSSTPTGR